jgi:transcription-repair coupling factor (superfamily II helicase)
MLQPLTKLISRDAAFKELCSRLTPGSSTPALVPGPTRPAFMAALESQLGVPLLLVAASPEAAARFADQLAAWSDHPVEVFPEPDTLPYQTAVSDSASAVERIRLLKALLSGEAPLVVTSAAALMARLPDPLAFAESIIYVKVGEEIEPYQLISRLLRLGYHNESLVAAPGTLAHRGGIVDLYSPSEVWPLRLEFFGNTLESLRRFDPETQLSTESLTEASLSAASELLRRNSDAGAALSKINLDGLNPDLAGPLRERVAALTEGEIPEDSGFFAPYFNQSCLLDYVRPDTLVVNLNTEIIQQAAEERHTEAEEIRAGRRAAGEIPQVYPRPYFTWAELETKFETRPRLAIADWESAPGVWRLAAAEPPNFVGQLIHFIDYVKQRSAARQTTVVVSHQASRLAELLLEEDVIAPELERLEAVPPPGSVSLVHGSINGGWIIGDDTCVLSDRELFGFVKQRRVSRTRRAAVPPRLREITPGDYVVHLEHGIARFSGVTTLRGQAQNSREYLTLEYADGDRLYVPSDQVDRLEIYVGGSDQSPRLSRLHTQEWARAKARVSESAQEVAAELLTLYASREVSEGHIFQADHPWQTEMEAAFPYVETPDQAQAWEQVRADMQRARPMDRLVCGDAGYGKTEVALRAAFKAVTDGKQVVFLVPTTVLAEQHYATFKERFEPFPVVVEVLSRFRSPAEQKEILEKMERGGVDICIGTHRLLQKDVILKDLGLVIIDEEQRFGVNHKEFLKQLRTEVDVLTLSATPIPRTLHMALVGVRDMSHIETPPEQRLPVKTYVAQASDSLVREVVLRELERGGQVFYVHNRVKSIEYEARRLARLVPEGKIVTGHGQMPEAELEAVMQQFTDAEADVLVCTTIIESGLDLPNANTLIVNQADRFGLTQLYQLRGRVGRGANLAFAYFLYERGKRLTPVAAQRLRTIFEATELGSGYNIAMKDLEIRGAGNILGVKQSGQINSVGFHLYVRLLADAVAEQKSRLAGETPPGPKLPEPSVVLPLAAFLPETYVPDLDVRLYLYHRLTAISDDDALHEFGRELRDRFGEPPKEVKNLLFAVRIKRLARAAGIEAIVSDGGALLLRRFSGWHFDKDQLAEISGEGVRVALNQVRLDYVKLGRRWRKVLEEVLAIVAG